MTDGSGSVDAVNAAEVTPEQFWARFVSQRRPALLRGHPQDGAWRASDRWTNLRYLVERVNAGAAVPPTVMVERRQRPGDPFGRGTKQRMTFSDFVAALEAGEEGLYLTTQEAPVSAMDGHPHPYTTPVAQLAGDIPLSPGLAGCLVLQSINLWMGASAQGSSSGLHHDFHDNLYILLSGRKTFRLWPPGAAPRMYLHGEVAWTHPNGRVVYRGQGDVLADGTDAEDVQRWEERAAVEAEWQQAGAAWAGGEPGAKKRLARAERRFFEMVRADPLGQGADAADSEDPSDDADDGGRPRTEGGEEPPSFSRVDLSLSDEQLRRSFPLFPGRASALTVTVRSGEMLYLPAGWFHEVTSLSEAGPSSKAKAHMALNYWFHPPDNLDPSPAGYAHPYVRDYLPSLWEKRQRLYRGAGGAARPPPTRGPARFARPADVEGRRSEEEEEEEEEAEAKAELDERPRAAAAALSAGVKRHAPASGIAAAGGSRVSLWEAAERLVTGAAGAGARGEAHEEGRASKRRARGVQWQRGVVDPPNRYRMSTTRAGSASGSPMKVPEGPALGRARHAAGLWGGAGAAAVATGIDAYDSSDDEDYVPEGGALPPAGAGDLSGRRAAARAARGCSGRAGGADSAADGDSPGDGGGDEDGEGREGGADVKEEVARAMRQDPGMAAAMRALLAAAMRRHFGGGGGGGGGGEGEGEGERGEQQRARRMPRPPWGRRHHLFVALRSVPRAKATRGM